MLKQIDVFDQIVDYKHMTLFVPHRAPSFRQKRVAESIRSVVAIQLSPNNRPVVMNKQGKPLANPGFLTVTHVDVTADLKLATIHVWPFDRNKLAEVLPYLDGYAPALKREIAHQLNLRFTPEIRFCLDKTLDAADRIDNLLDQ